MTVPEYILKIDPITGLFIQTEATPEVVEVPTVVIEHPKPPVIIPPKKKVK